MELELAAGPPRRGVFELVCHGVNTLDVLHEVFNVVIPHDLCVQPEKVRPQEFQVCPHDFFWMLFSRYRLEIWRQRSRAYTEFDAISKS